jgi:hypothetical protein
MRSRHVSRCPRSSSSRRGHDLGRAARDSLLFFAIIIASAIRPGVEALKRRRIPRGIGVLLHYAVLLGIVAGGLWLVVPAAIDQVQSALGPEHGLREEAQSSTGIKHDLLIALDRRLNDVPSGSERVSVRSISCVPSCRARSARRFATAGS